MEDKMFVGVSVTIKDGRFFFDIMADKGLSLEDIRSILVGGVAYPFVQKKPPNFRQR
jgi:hypothetical protein